MTDFERVALHKHPCRTTGDIAVTKHPLATQAALEAYRDGGNAVDAALAASFVLGVVEPAMSGIGGVGLGIVRHEGQMDVIDGGPISPYGLQRERYVVSGTGDDDELFGWPLLKDSANIIGATSVCVPTMVAVALAAALHAGRATLPWSRLLQPAIDLARDGFEPDWLFTLHVVSDQTQLSRFPTTRAVYMPEGRVPVYTMDTNPGPRFTNPALAGTLETLAREGPDAMYGGAIGTTISTFIRAQGGDLAPEDFPRYSVRIGEPRSTPFDGHEVWVTDGLNGGPTVAAMLSAFGSRPHAPWGSTDDLVNWIEVGRQAFADRLSHLGHAASSTTYLATADRDGNCVSLNLTLLSGWGSRLVEPETGILLNNGIMWFDPRPGRANSLAPGSRPLANMAPILATRDGDPALVLGASGGRRIIGAVAQIVTNALRHGMSMQDAIAAPRLELSQSPMLADARFPDEVVRAAEERTGGTLRRYLPRVGSSGFASPAGLLWRDDRWESGMDPTGTSTSACRD